MSTKQLVEGEPVTGACGFEQIGFGLGRTGTAGHDLLQRKVWTSRVC